MEKPYMGDYLFEVRIEAGPMTFEGKFSFPVDLVNEDGLLSKEELEEVAADMTIDWLRDVAIKVELKGKVD
jgi:hypothetical protein